MLTYTSGTSIKTSNRAFIKESNKVPSTESSSPVKAIHNQTNGRSAIQKKIIFCSHNLIENRL
jgi:hypothetical protein